MKVLILIFSLILCSCIFGDGTVCVEPFTLPEPTMANKRNIEADGVFKITIDAFEPIEVTTAKGGSFQKVTQGYWHTVDIRYNDRPFAYTKFYFDEYKSKHLRLVYFPEYGYWQLLPVGYKHQCKLQKSPGKSQ
jgi:hypothetical protein